MRAALKHVFAAALAVVTAATPALAREDFCLNANGSRNPTATNGYRQIERTRNEATMRRINGIWFSQTRNPFTGQISYLWETFEGRGAQAGLYSYANIVCDSAVCSRWYEGTGLWAVKGGVRKFSGMMIVSDLNLDHFCRLVDGSLSESNAVWTNAAGGVLRRASKVGEIPR